MVRQSFFTSVPFLIPTGTYHTQPYDASHMYSSLFIIIGIIIPLSYHLGNLSADSPDSINLYKNKQSQMAMHTPSFLLTFC